MLEDKRAEDVVWLDVREVTDLADAFLIATITNPRQGAAIVDECEKERKRLGLPRIGIEGEQGATWVILDYGEIVVHLDGFSVVWGRSSISRAPQTVPQSVKQKWLRSLLSRSSTDLQGKTRFRLDLPGTDPTYMVE